MTKEEAREIIGRYVRQDLEWQQIAREMLDRPEGVSALQVTAELRRRLLERGEALVGAEQVQAAAEVLGEKELDELLSGARYKPEIKGIR